MDKIKLIRDFASLVAGERVIIPRKRDCWSLSMADAKPRLILPPDPDQNDEEDKAFRKDFVQRCLMARGFANVTLSILHEIGHHFNREAYIFSDVNEDEYESHFTLHNYGFRKGKVCIIDYACHLSEESESDSESSSWS